MGISFVDPIYLILLALIPPMWLVAIQAGRLRGRRRWLALGLRTLLMLSLILSLAGAQLVQPVRELTTVFLIDSSDSVSPAQRAEAEAFVEAALQAMRPGDRAAVVVFGENALVERAPSDERRLGRIQSVPVAARTNIAEALNLGLALFPSDTQKRIVLLSDGGENQGRALEALRLAQSRNIPIDIVPLGEAAGGSEAAVVELRSVSRARKGQAIELVARVESNTAQRARLRFLADNAVLTEQQVDIPVGSSSFTATVVVRDEGYRRYSAELLPEQDTRPQNNEAAALVEVEGPPRVLIIEGAPGESGNLASALEAAQLTPVVIPPSGIPADLPGLADYEVVVLANVPARDLPTSSQEALRSFVRDLGRGLVMIGGTQSYGVGGYTNTPVEEALPVYMDVRNRQQRPDIAIVFVIDKSGSMDACHCEGGDMSRRNSGVPKIDIAKDAVSQATAVLGKNDKVGVVAFDDSAHWVLKTTQLPDQQTIQDALAPTTANGGTNVASGLLAAEESLLATDAKIKHVILLTDGWSRGGDQTGTAQRMRDEGITLSVVAAGSGSADYLAKLAEAGGGRYYNARSMDDVPQIFLEETIQAVGTYIIEETFTPAYAERSPILDGLEQGLPPLRGYNGSSEKEQARVILVGVDGAPVLAQWQYGLGRSVAWTSDMKGKWAIDWVRWNEFPRFAAQLVGWTLPAVRSDTISVEPALVGGDVEINVAAVNEDGSPMTGLRVQATIVGGGVPQPVELREVAPGRYLARTASPASGTYLIQVGGVDENGKPIFVQTSGLIVPYSPEYRQGQSNPALLRALAEGSGGRELQEATAAFDHNLAAVQRALPISTPLLLLALLLLPLDIAIRRISMRWRDVAAARAARAAQRQREAAPIPTVGALQQAKARAQRRMSGAETPPPIASGEDVAAAAPAQEQPAQSPAARQSEPTKPLASPAPEQPAQPQPSLDEITDPLERLRAAKQRARRR
ncbi:MAG: VWA domain-containing protein [Herpetosiphonaceae bacterium]|nr:MAG: VWA domain-containing protein [Herpetosiphonaceae bacterium]